jgi:hypothetical protein
MAMLNEFKAFVMRGNVVDLAVGLIIGAAFGKIVTSLVNDILMPPIGLLAPSAAGDADYQGMPLLSLRHPPPGAPLPPVHVRPAGGVKPTTVTAA